MISREVPFQKYVYIVPIVHIKLGRLKRKKFYFEKMGFIKPEKVLLDRSIQTNNESFQVINCYGYYIPFDKTLEKIFQDLPSDIDLNCYSNEDLKNNVFDGKYLKKKKLCFCIYCDEVEFVNVIGSNRKTHKLSKRKKLI